MHRYIFFLRVHASLYFILYQLESISMLKHSIDPIQKISTAEVQIWCRCYRYGIGEHEIGQSLVYNQNLLHELIKQEEHLPMERPS